MASARKKQDEKNMKTLRELAALQYNKYCFDCNQRGPTYVNVTTGSFVCTKCSGILRGLTPPHRVKSISMATFTVEEVEFLRIRGNSYCRRTWLGLYDGSVAEMPDEQAVRDFMIDKYERKRYYMEVPTDAQQPISLTTTTPPADNFFSQNRSVEVVPRNNKKVAEFVADFGTADIYNASNVKDTNMNDNIEPFANFSDSYNSNAVNNNGNNTNWNNTSFHASFKQTPVVVPKLNAINVPDSTFPTVQEKTAPTLTAPSVDRYAALKDLDSIFNTQSQIDWNSSLNGFSSPSSSLYSSPSEHSSTYGSSQLFPAQEIPKISNPFNTKILWDDEVKQPMPANPFRTIDTSTKLNGITPSVYKSVPFSTNTGSSWVPNPFTSAPSNSSNPFL